MLANWFFKLGSAKHREHEKFAKGESPLLMIGFGVTGPVNNFRSKEQIEELLKNISDTKSIPNNSAQIYKFVNVVQVGDIFATKIEGRIRFCEIVSACQEHENGQLIRKLRWVSESFDPNDFDAEFINSLQAPMTICRAKRTYDPIFFMSADKSKGLVYGSLDSDIDQIGALEGQIRSAFINHIWRERDPEIVKKRKGEAPKPIRCEACNFSFSDKYGAIGSSFIECHHIEPIGKRRQASKTTQKYLALLCSNCHRMIHRLMAQKTDSIIEISEFRSIIIG